MTQEESLYRSLAVFDWASHGSFSCSSEISFHGRCPRIEDTEDISVVGPLDSKNLFQTVRQFLKCRWISWFSHNSKFGKPLQENLSSDHRLNHISSIQAVHAISSEYSFLRIDLRKPTTGCASLGLHMEISIVLYLFAADIQ